MHFLCTNNDLEISNAKMFLINKQSQQAEAKQMRTHNQLIAYVGHTSGQAF